MVGADSGIIDYRHVQCESGINGRRRCTGMVRDESVAIVLPLREVGGSAAIHLALGIYDSYL